MNSQRSRHRMLSVLSALFLQTNTYLSISTVDDMGLKLHIGKQEKTN
jgi:hypothetical protein